MSFSCVQSDRQPAFLQVDNIKLANLGGIEFLLVVSDDISFISDFTSHIRKLQRAGKL